MSGKSGITILWVGKDGSFTPSFGAATIFESKASSLYHEFGHTFYRFVKGDSKQAGKALDYENKVRKQSHEFSPENENRPYDEEHKDPNAN